MPCRFKGPGLVVLAGVLALGACSKEAPQRGGPGGPVPVVMATVQAEAWSDDLQALGTARARESVTLTAKVSEIVEQVHFESGQQVRAGQPLVTLRAGAQHASLAEAQANLAEAEQQLRRMQELAVQQLVSRSTLDSQRATRDVAAARVRQMQSDIGDRVVRAPFSGVVGLRQVSPGALVTASSVIATLDDIGSMYVDFTVPETALPALQPGASVRARSAAWPGREFEGRVQTVDARIDPQTRAVTVRAEFDNPGAVLRPGMLLDVRLEQSPRQALVVPEIAVVQEGNHSFVYRVGGDGTVEKVEVRTGTRRAGRAEIREGLAANDRIVADGVGKLRPGLKVVEAGAREAGAPAAVPANASGRK